MSTISCQTDLNWIGEEMKSCVTIILALCIKFIYQTSKVSWCNKLKFLAKQSHCQTSVNMANKVHMRNVFVKQCHHCQSTEVSASATWKETLVTLLSQHQDTWPALTESYQMTKSWKPLQRQQMPFLFPNEASKHGKELNASPSGLIFSSLTILLTRDRGIRLYNGSPVLVPRNSDTHTTPPLNSW